MNEGELAAQGPGAVDSWLRSQEISQVTVAAIRAAS
jgi:hypothetical protein